MSADARQLPLRSWHQGRRRPGFADYARDGETARELRGGVNRVLLGDLEQKVLALSALHAELGDLDAGEPFGDVVARSRPVGRE